MVQSRKMVLSVAVLLGPLGCVETATFQCQDVICAAGTACVDSLGACYSVDAIDACNGAADGASCMTPTIADGVCAAGVCFDPGCGDGVIKASEDCDGANLAGSTCQSLGFYDESPLACASDCNFDVSSCTGFCGDQAVNGFEACDGDEFSITDCRDLGYYSPGVVTCTPICTIDASGCADYCGDGVVNGPELCDDSLPLQECFDLGFDFGSTTCSSLCGLEFSECSRIGFYQVASVFFAALHLRRVETHGTGYLGVAGDWFGDPSPYVFNGGSWTRTNGAGQPSDLAKIGDDYFVTGSHVAKWNGTSWNQLFDLPTYNYAIEGLAADDIYTVGAAGLIHHFNGTGWTEVNDSGVAENLYDVAVISANDIYAVGAAGTILHFNGSGWSSVNDTGLTLDIRAIKALTADNVYAVGVGGRVYHWNGAAWSVIQVSASASLASIDALAADNIMIVTQTGGAFHFNGTAWYPMGQATADYQEVIVANGEYLVAAGIDGVHRFEDAGWALAPPLTSSGSYATAWLANRSTGYVGGGNEIRKFTGNSYGAPVQLAIGANIRAIAGVDENTVYAAGNGLYKFNGATWDLVDTTPIANGDAYSALWMDSESAIFAASGNQLIRYDGTDWTETVFPGENFAAMHGTGPTNVYAVSQQNTAVFHYDGLQWSTIDIGATRGLSEVFAAENHIFVGSSLETVMHHFDGQSWETVPTVGGGSVQALAGTSPTDVYAAQFSTAQLVHYDGVRWSRVRLRNEATYLYLLATSEGSVIFGNDQFVDSFSVAR